MHTHEIRNRIAYAQRMVTHLDKVTPGIEANTLTLWNHASWVRATSQAGEAVPSEATISVIVALVKGRELALEAIRNSISVVKS